MRSIVVTGASSGIGAALARRAAARGWSVLAVARRADRLDALAREIQCEALVADVLAPSTPSAIVERALRAFGRIDVVVNNAGAAHASTLLEESEVQIERQWQLHVGAPLRIARAALPHVEQSHGGFVFFGSGLARVPAPGYGAYAPAKAAVRAAAIQLRRELRARGVFVTYVDPGVVDTEFSRASGMREHPAWWHATPDAVAAAILRGIERRASRVNAVPWQTAATVFGEWFPALADRAMASLVTPPAQSPPPPAVETAPAATSLQRRMERVKLPVSFVRELLAPGTEIDLNEAAMRWAGMPNKNERAALREVLDALARAGFLQPEGEERWRVLRGATEAEILHADREKE
ncbi:MAG TPA: SDR family NAD(P)-dependent oxidoreductase [Candidatus Acidoferrales bacterium]|nr:SDR family NAD(P)-dependent oxidoreductase [Candidatus Acidoferrales bacterium]